MRWCRQERETPIGAPLSSADLLQQRLRCGQDPGGPRVFFCKGTRSDAAPVIAAVIGGGQELFEFENIVSAVPRQAKLTMSPGRCHIHAQAEMDGKRTVEGRLVALARPLEATRLQMFDER